VQLQEQADSLQAYQLAFTFAALQKLGAPMGSACIDKVRACTGGCYGWNRTWLPGMLCLKAVL
jgi:hypothetical protein